MPGGAWSLVVSAELIQSLDDKLQLHEYLLGGGVTPIHELGA